VLVSRDNDGQAVKVEWFETEDHWYLGDPMATASYDTVLICRQCPVHVASDVFRLYGMGKAGFAAAADKVATHMVAEPGAPLEPIVRSAA